MEDSNANRGDGTVVLILKTARDWELSLGTSRLTDSPKHWNLAWNSFWTFSCAPTQKVWEVSLSTLIGCEEAPGYHGTFSWMPVSQHALADLIGGDSFQDFTQKCQVFWLQVRFWIWMTWKQHRGVSSHCLCFSMVPSDFIFGIELTFGCTQRSTTRRLPVCKAL